MKILVAVASKHGGTAEIGAAIAHALDEKGHAVANLPLQDVTAVEQYDAVILGSGVYAGHWLGEAKAFASRHAAALRQRPVWLLSSGPLGDPPEPAGDPVDVSALVEELAPRGHVVFAGVLERSKLGFAERAIVGVVKAPYGDFRDWEAITAWAGEVHRALVSEPVLTA